MSAAEAHPGHRLLHPLPVAAALLILWNDFWLRRHHPGFWSGKLSDVGICFLLPVVLVAVWEWGAWILDRVRRRPWRPASRTVCVLACTVTAAYYAAMELWPSFGRFHDAWLTAVFTPLLSVRFRPGTPDPTDLLALVLVPVAGWWMVRRGAG